MGKDFVSVRKNHLSFNKAFDLLINGEWVEGTTTRKPKRMEVADIDIGTSGTNESIFRLKNGGFYVVSKTVNINKLKEVI